MAVTYRARPGIPAGHRPVTGRRRKSAAPAVRTRQQTAARSPRPAHADLREARCEVLSRRIVVLSLVSMLMFVAGFFMTIPHAVLCLFPPVALAFSARHRLDVLQDELRLESAGARVVERASES